MSQKPPPLRGGGGEPQASRGWVLLALLLAFPVRAAAPPNPMPPASVTSATLENGITVITRADPSAPLVAVDLWVGAGATDDGGTGAAHALEHMVFKGGKDVPAGAVDAQVEAAGGVLYAETLADATHYWTTVPPDKTGDVLAALDRLMREPTVDPDAWKLERNVMLEEVARSRRDAAAELRRDLMLRLFGPAYGAPVAGTPESLAALTPEQIRAFFARYYRPDRMTLVVVGPVSGADIRKRAAETLGKRPAAPGKPPAPAAVPAPRTRDAEISRRDGNRVEVGLAFAAPKGAAVDVLCTLLASRLSAQVTGRADRVEVSHPWQRAGLVVLAVGGPSGIEAALRAALRRVAATPPESLSDAAVAAAIRRRQWAWWLDHEKPADQAKALGLAATLGDLGEATEAPERLTAVTVAAVRAAARALSTGPPPGG